jgi:signal transduction histidine kinase
MVYAIHEDREGSLWVGTMHGLDQFLDGLSIPYTAREGLPSNRVGPVVADRNGYVWVGTLDRGLGRFDGNRFSLLDGQRRDSPRISAILEDGDDGLWVGSDAGLTYLRGGRLERTYSVANGLPANAVRCLFRDHSGVLWAGTSSGPAKLQGEKFVQPGGLPERLKTQIIAIGEDRTSQLYFGTEDRGLYTYAKNEARELWLNDGAPPRITAFYLDPQGLLWMTAQGRGLRLVRDGKVVSFGMKDGLFDNGISGLVADDRDRLWLAGSKGIFSLSRSELLAFADEKIHKVVAKAIDPARPIECISGVTPTASRGPDGRLWFSTRGGVIVFDPNHMAREVPPPPVVIEDVTVNGESTPPASIERIPPGRRNLEFRYTGLSLLDPSRITFRYILDGFEKEWTNAGTRREAFYTNLPPGNYRFRVTACNADGVCNESGHSVEFALAHYYYQGAWFLPLCVITLAGMAGLAHKLRVRHLRNQLSLVLAERSRIARELHDTLIQGFSGLTLQLQAMSGRLQSADEREMLNDIISDAGTYLRETRQSVASLRSEQGPGSGLATAIDRFARQITAESGIRLKVKLDENLQKMPAEVQYNLLRIAQEAISNSVKHSGARTIEVALAGSTSEVSLSVTDDGSGLERQENENVNGGHYGLIGMHERAAEIGGNLKLVSAPGKGTTVSVLVPAGRSDKGLASRNGSEGAR